jgi:hypothetical protein
MLAGACRARTLAELADPVHLWNQESGFCGFTWAVDGDGVVWAEGGCETGPTKFERKRRASDEALRRLRASFERLPPPVDPAPCPKAGHRFVHRTAPGRETEWRVCSKSTKLADATGLDPAFAEVIHAFDLALHEKD